MAQRCARLALLALAAAGGAEAQDRGDAVALVQHRLESQSAPEDLYSDGVATVIGSFVNMMKFENLIRKSVFGEDAAATTKGVSLARDVPDEEVPPFKVDEPPESKMPKSKTQEVATAGESVKVDATVGSGFWNVGKGKMLSRAVMTRAGANCSSRDLENMHKALDDYSQLAEESGPSGIQYAVPPVCREALTFGIVDLAKFETCIQQTLEISPSCSKCHVNVMKGVAAKDIFHPRCAIPCIDLLGSCTVDKDDTPSEKCMSTMGKCFDCAMPEIRKQAPCIGGIINNKETLEALQTLATKLRKGKMTTPREFREAMEEVYDKAEKIE